MLLLNEPFYASFLFKIMGQSCFCLFALQQEADLVGVLAGDERFATLVVAVQAAELVETLQGGLYNNYLLALSYDTQIVFFPMLKYQKYNLTGSLSNFCLIYL